jgi:hypothetical protein
VLGQAASSAPSFVTAAAAELQRSAALSYKMEDLILPAIFVLAGVIALYRGSLFTNLQDGMNKYVYEKDRYLSWNIDYQHIVGYGLIIVGTVLWLKSKL